MKTFNLKYLLNRFRHITVNYFVVDLVRFLVRLHYYVDVYLWWCSGHWCCFPILYSTKEINSFFGNEIPLQVWSILGFLKNSFFPKASFSRKNDHSCPTYKNHYIYSVVSFGEQEKNHTHTKMPTILLFYLASLFKVSKLNSL